jgi:hypothetical protein
MPLSSGVSQYALQHRTCQTAGLGIRKFPLRARKPRIIVQFSVIYHSAARIDQLCETKTLH